MKTKNSLITLLIVLFGISFVLNCVQFRSAKNQEYYRFQENLKFQAALHLKRAEILKSDSLIREIRQQMTIDSAIHQSVVNRLKKRIQQLTAKLPVLEPITPHEDTVCARFIASTLQKDTIIATQDSLIYKLEERATELVGSFRVIINQKDSVILSQIAIRDMWQGQAANFEQLFRKADKQARKRISIGPYIGVGWPGPVQVGVGVSYSIVRF